MLSEASTSARARRRQPRWRRRGAAGRKGWQQTNDRGWDVSLLDNLILLRWRDTMVKDITHADVQRWISGLSVDGSVRTEGKGLLPSG